MEYVPLPGRQPDTKLSLCGDRVDLSEVSPPVKRLFGEPIKITVGPIWEEDLPPNGEGVSSSNGRAVARTRLGWNRTGDQGKREHSR